MRIVPLARKARDIARGREVVESHIAHPMRFITLAVVFVLTVLVTSPSLWTNPLPTHAGEVVRHKIVAVRAFDYRPENIQDLWESRRLAEHERWFTYDSRVSEQARARLEKLLSAAAALDSTQGSPEEWRATLAVLDPQVLTWSPEHVRGLLTIAGNERLREGMQLILTALLRDHLLTPDKRIFETHRQVARVQNAALPPENAGQGLDASKILLFPQEAHREIDIRLRELFVTVPSAPEGTAEAARELLRTIVKPNLEFNKAATEKARNEFGERFPMESLVEKVAAGTILVDVPPGTSVTINERQADKLSAYAAIDLHVKWAKFGVQVLFVMIAFLIISFFVKKFSREMHFNTQTVLLLGLPVLLALGLGRIFLILGGDAVPNVGFAFPAGVIGILGVMLLEVRLALLLVTWGCLLFGLEANLDYQYVIVGLFGGYAAVAALYTFKERREVLYAGLLIGAINAATILIIKYIGDSTQDVLQAAVIGALSGIMCSLISFAVLPVFEVAFHLTTDLRLLELSGLQHPLLRRMEEIAPGTWQHTLNVTKLAESAATAIGVNYLLVRAGCYFHDVGKMFKPEAFTENQTTRETKRFHEDKKPQMSTLVIRNHVKEGLELAREYNLPKVVTDFIPEHHGTSLIAYFYHKALTAYENGETKEPVREEDYRYPGPKPQSIEAAVVMLADTVEATATAKLSGRHVRDDDIQMLVRNAIFEKFNDGQFDHCNLTMRDLNLIRESFIKTLRSRFHTRIDYPGARKKQQTVSDTTKSDAGRDPKSEGGRKRDSGSRVEDTETTTKTDTPARESKDMATTG